MEKRSFLSLTDEEVRTIVIDMFGAKKVTCIKRNKKYDEITCKMYTEWESYDDKGDLVTNLIMDELTLCNPFKYGNDSINSQYPIDSKDYTKLKQFCFAKGIYGTSLQWLLENPYQKTIIEIPVFNQKVEK